MKRLLLVVLLGLLGLAVDSQAQVACPAGVLGCGTSGSSSTTTVDTISAAQSCTDAVGTDAYACSSTNCPAAIANGQAVLFEAATLNTGAATFAFCAQAAKALVRYVGGISTPLVTGDILAKQRVAATYNLADDNWKMYSVPASAGLKADTNTWTAAQTFSGGQIVALDFRTDWGVGATGFASARSAMTPDGLVMGSASNSIHLIEAADTAFDFNNGVCGTAQCTDPSLIAHSHNQDTQEYISLSHDGNAGSVVAANSTQKSGEIKLGRTVTLTEAGAAEVVITITTATTQSFGLELNYKVSATDATVGFADREGSLKLVCHNLATVVTCTKDATAQTDDESVLISSTATLTYAIAADVATANVAKLTFDVDSDLTVTAASITWTAILNGSGVIS